MRNQRNQVFRIGRAFDQDDVGRTGNQGQAQTARRTGAVVANAEELDVRMVNDKLRVMVDKG